MVLFTKLLTYMAVSSQSHMILSMALFTKLLTKDSNDARQIWILSMVLFTKLLTVHTFIPQVSRF